MKDDSIMPANVYECMFLLDSSKVAGDVGAADKVLRDLLEKHQAEVLISRPWDERRLSYPVANQKKGMYYLTYFSAEGTSLLGIEQDCKLNEMIIRQLVLKIHPKLVDTMLSVAKGEHAVALHNIHDDGEGGTDGTPEGEGAPRRPRGEGRDRDRD